MTNETEKITINLGVVDLAQIDVLSEQGIYSNRSDFIRMAIRKQLEAHKEQVEQSLTPVASKKQWEKVIGIWTIDKATLVDWGNEANNKLNISVIGMLILGKDITPELFEATVGKVVVRGKIVASDEIKTLIKKME
ncbi:MAG: ribbon-helix-helix protein, CopG family [Defluviitaleaceae bacterium]|nr:ribbon-helix-helix protein, CopG family [Defluviitaleaceae bacterium]